MGEKNKLLLPYKGRPLVYHAVSAACQGNADEVLVVVGHEQEKVRQALEALPVKIVFNPDYAEGMTRSIQAGIGAANPHTDGYMIILGDMVHLRPQAIQQVSRAFRLMIPSHPRLILSPTFQGRKGHPVVFAASYREALLTWDDQEGARSLIRTFPTQVRNLPVSDPGICFDVDTPEAYKDLEDGP